MRAGRWDLALTSAFFAASASFTILFSCFFSSESLTPAEQRHKRSQGRAAANQHTTQSSGGARTELAAQVLEERAGPLRQRLALRDLRRERGR